MKLRFAIAFVVLLLMVPVVAWIAGSRMTAPAQERVGDCPAVLRCESVEFESESGAMLRGWFVEGRANRGTVVLMHGLRANRRSLAGRATFLNRSGYSVLAFDFRASGESTGDRLTFGYLERLDAEAAVRFARGRRPVAGIGVIGVSMGGAAFLLAEKMPPVDAVVLEMVYPTMDSAIANRLDHSLFPGARFFSPLLTFQFPLRIGVGVWKMRPVERIGHLRVPVLIVGGADDPFTTAEESEQLFAAANEPKDIWIADGVGHQDIHKLRAPEYENRILGFLETRINLGR